MKNIQYLILILAIISCQANKKPIQNELENSIPVSIASPKYTSIEYTETYTANISGEPLTPVLPEVLGKFIKYSVNEGQYVNKDDVIGYLDRSTIGLEFNEYPVKAPASGKVHLLNISIGQMLSPSTPIAQIYGNPIAIIKLPSIHYSKVKPGDRVEIYSDDLGIKETTKIYYKSDIIDPLSQTFEVRARVYKFPIGAFASAKIILARKSKALVIPTSAILGLDKKYVFILNGNKAYKRVIKIGIQNEEHTEVLEGLSENDKIVIEGQYNLQDGSKVEIVK